MARAPSTSRSVTATTAPSAASLRHVAAPMPPAAPVTSATFPSSLTGGTLKVVSRARHLPPIAPATGREGFAIRSRRVLGTEGYVAGASAFAVDDDLDNAP